MAEFAETVSSEKQEEQGFDKIEGDERPFPLMEKNLEQAKEAKEKGNTFFRAKDYDMAIELYSQAINLCPDEVNEEELDDDESSDSNENNDEEPVVVEIPAISEADTLLATCLSNRAACFAAVDEWDMVVDDCNWALDKNPLYTKVLVRRSQANEKLERIDEALQDMKRVQEMDKSWPKVSENIVRLQKLHDDNMEKMKAEAVGKLKDLGNSLLGNFGMSLDNFNFKQDEKTGSWSMGTNN